MLAPVTRVEGSIGVIGSRECSVPVQLQEFVGDAPCFGAVSFRKSASIGRQWRSVKAACELLGLNWQAAHQVMERAVERGLDARVLEGLRIVGMDEKSFLSGQSYASLLYEVDPENSRVLEVMMDRDGDAAELLWETLPQEVREAIEAVCLDMSGIYRENRARQVPCLQAPQRGGGQGAPPGKQRLAGRGRRSAQGRSPTLSFQP